MGEKRGMKALEAWCKKVTDGYQGVKIDNMTTCWRDGLAFCAIIHHFRPDLIDFDNLEKNDIFHNNELAFRTAENHLGIPALLDAEDMVEFEVPDRLSILTYLSQFYQTFTRRQQGSSPARVVSKRPISTDEGVLSPVSESPPSKVAARSGRREPCAKCGLPVFIAERLLVSGRTLYHRTCFRCARCQHQLSLANFYETEGGEYCCETCPDEVRDSSNLEDKSKVASQTEEGNLDMIGHSGPQDEYSAEFELALEKLKVPCISEVKEQPEMKHSKARSDFMFRQLNLPELQDAKELSSVGGNEKTLPKPEQQGIDNNKDNVCSLISHYRALERQNIDHASNSDLNTSSLNSVHKIQDKVTTKDNFVNIDNTPPYDSECNVVAKHFSTKSVIPSTVGDSLFSGSSVPLKVSSSSPNCGGGGGNQLEARNNSVALKGVHDKELNSFGDTSSSIVKKRRKLFENSGNTEENTKASETSSNNKSAVYQKDERNSAPLGLPITRDVSVEPADGKLLDEANKVEVQESQDGQEKPVAALDISKEEKKDERNSDPLGLPITRDVSVEPADGKLLVEANKVEVQGNQDGQEKSVAALDISKEESKGEMLQTMEIVGLPLKDDSEPHIGDAVQGIDSKDRMANITVSGLSGMQELDKNDILKDASSIRVLEAGDFQTSSASSKSTTAAKNSGILKDTSSIKVLEGGDFQTTSVSSKSTTAAKNSGILKDTSSIKVLEGGDFQTTSASSKSTTAAKNSGILKDTSSIKVLEAGDFQTSSASSKSTTAVKNSGILKDTSSIKVLEAGDFQTTSASSKSTTAAKNSGILKDKSSIKVLEVGDFQTSSASSKSTTAAKNSGILKDKSSIKVLEGGDFQTSSASSKSTTAAKNSGILKDTSSIKVLETGDFQTSSASSKSTTAGKNSGILKDTSSIKVLEGGDFQTSSASSKGTTAAKNSGILKDTSSIKVLEAGDFQTSSVSSKSTTAGKNSSILKDTSSIKVLEGGDFQTSSASSKGTTAAKNSGILKDTSSIKVLEDGDFQTSSVSSKSTTAGKNSGILKDTSSIKVLEGGDFQTSSASSKSTTAGKNSGILKDTSSIKVLEAGDFQTSSASSKSTTAGKNSDILKDTSSIKVLEGGDFQTSSASSKCTPAGNNSDILKDTSSIKSLEAGDFQTSSVSSKSTPAGKNSDILKDTSSIKVLEGGDFQTSSASSKSTPAAKNSGILKDTSSIKVLEGGDFQTSSASSKSTTAAKNSGILNDTSSIKVLEGGDFQTSSASSKSTPAAKNSGILKDTSSIKVLEGGDFQTSSASSKSTTAAKNSGILNDTSSIKVLEGGDFQTSSASSKSTLAAKNSGILNDTSSIKVLEGGDFQTSSASSKSTTARKNSDCSYPSELNPFGDDGDDTEQRSKESVNCKPSERKVVQEMNPFGSTDDEAEMQIMVESPTPPVLATRDGMKVLKAPKVNLNPFWSDGEEPSSGDEIADSLCSKSEKLPVPRPRTVTSVTPEPRPLPRKSLMTKSSDKFGSASSLSSLSSAGGSSSHKKKKPAPAPPRAQDLFPETLTAPSDNSSEASSPCPSLGYSLSPVATSRHRKSRPAPPPPTEKQGTAAVSFSDAKLVVEKLEDSHFHISEGEREKNKKDVTNRNRQSQTSNTVSFGEQQLILEPNKSTYGQWKRKKGPAPPRPVPQRRRIKVIPMKEVKTELDDIEVQQQELERQGVTLEKTIRDKFDQAANMIDDTSMPPDVEDLVLQLFELVNEKNELFRRQAELMYLRRQQRLEEEHADLEYQIRCLMDVPEHTKTDSDKAREEELIQRLVEVVERRNEVVECLEMDRIREAEEDRSIRSRLGMLSKGKILCQEEVTLSNSYSGKLKKKKRDKEKQSNKKAVKSETDVDKDVDEREESLPKHTKEKKSKRKWF